MGPRPQHLEGAPPIAKPTRSSLPGLQKQKPQAASLCTQMRCFTDTPALLAWLTTGRRSGPERQLGTQPAAAHPSHSASLSQARPLLQDTSAHEVSPAHAASLPTVRAALEAMRRAHTAVQNLAAAHSPQRQASQQPWTSEVMEGLLLSPDSQHCLVLYHVRRRNGDMRYGAAVHALATGRRLCTLSQEGRESCTAQFSPCSKRLSIATYTGPFDAMSCSLAVYETATWEPAYAKCSPQAEAALGVHGLDWRCGGVWAPDGRRFLYKGVDKPASGCMYIIDALSGQLEAALTEIQAFHASQGGLSEAGWHPGSAGVVSTARAWRLTGAHTAALQAAGLAVGALQAPFAASFDQALDEGPRFSPDGAMLLAQHSLNGHQLILSCTAQGQDLVFTPMHALSAACEALQAARWHVVPGGACLVLLEAKGSCRLVTPGGGACGAGLGEHQHAVSPRGLALGGLLHRAPEHDGLCACLGLGAGALPDRTGGSSGQGAAAEGLLVPLRALPDRAAPVLQALQSGLCPRGWPLHHPVL